MSKSELQESMRPVVVVPRLGRVQKKNPQGKERILNLADKNLEL